MKLKYLPLISILALASCDDYLDVKPMGKLIPTQVEEFENILNNTNTLDFHFMDNNRGNFYAMLGDNLEISENQAAFNYISSNPNIECYAAYTFYLPYQNPLTDQYTWSWGVYRAVGLLNNVVEGIEGLEGGAESEYGKQVIAQAKAARAWSYMVGGLGYGPMYDPNGENNIRTIPYRTSASPLEPNPDLATTAQLFDYLQQDLDAALNAPDNVANPCRANKAAVYALRAEMYMYKRDWDNMLESATEAWNRAVSNNGGVDNLIYDYNQFYYEEDPSASPSPGTDVEVGLELKGPDPDFDKSYSRENLFYRVSPTGYTTTTFYPSEDFLSLFDKENDLRYKLFMLKTLGYSTTEGDVKYDDGIRVVYFRGNKTLMNEGITYPILLLMKAEAEARTNDLSNALNDLNLLRKYRYSNTINTDLPGGDSMSADELLYEILKERRREQPINSYQRVFDIKRYVFDSGKPWSQTEIVHKIGEKTYSAPIDNEHYTLPLSNVVIEYNPQWGLEPNDIYYDPTSNK